MDGGAAEPYTGPYCAAAISVSGTITATAPASVAAINEPATLTTASQPPLRLLTCTRRWSDKVVTFATRRVSAETLPSCAHGRYHRAVTCARLSIFVFVLALAGACTGGTLDA